MFNSSLVLQNQGDLHIN